MFKTSLSKILPHLAMCALIVECSGGASAHSESPIIIGAASGLTETLANTSDVATPPAAANTPVGVHGRLSVLDGHLVDRHNKRVTLRGMSLFWSQSGSRFYNCRTLQTLRDDWNVNVVRASIGVELGGYLTNPDAEMHRARNVVDAAIALGLYVIIDWHAHDAHPTEATEFFETMSNAYGRSPNVLFEDWNEPRSGYSWSSIKQYHTKLTDVIRKHSNNVIILGTQNWSSGVDIAANDPVLGSNLMYSLHFYAGTHKDPYRAKSRAAIARGLPIFVTEWGLSTADNKGALDYKEAKIWLEWLDDQQISHLNWSLTDYNEAGNALVSGAPAWGWNDSNLTDAGRFGRNVSLSSNEHITGADLAPKCTS